MAQDAFERRSAPQPADEAADAVNQLRQGNAEAAATLWEGLKHVAHHPLAIFQGFGSMLVEPFIHPMRGFNRIKQAWQNEGPIEGALAGVQYASTAVTTASFAVMAVAFILAPFTAGASLAVAVAASQVMVYTGFLDAGLTTANLIKDEVDLARADTPEKYEREVTQLSDDYVNTAFAWLTLPLTDGQTAVTTLPQGLAVAGRSALKRPVSIAARSGLRAFRGLHAMSNVPREQDADLPPKQGRK